MPPPPFSGGNRGLSSLLDFAKVAYSIEDLWTKVGNSYSLYIKPDDTLFFDRLYEARNQIFNWGYREVEKNVFVRDDRFNSMQCIECAVIRRASDAGNNQMQSESIQERPRADAIRALETLGGFACTHCSL